MVDPLSIHEGMKVRCLDGERLGTVIGIGEEHFQVEQGLLSPREYLVDYADVAHVTGSELTLTRRRDELQPVVLDDGGCVPPRGASDFGIDTEPGYSEP